MTPLSSHELGQGWEDDVPDPSIYVRFRLKRDPDTSILAWTTTPWTLPGNVALAVDENVDYVKVRQGSEFLILAEARLQVLQGEYEIVERLKGADLVDLDYEPLYTYLPPKERAWFVVAADFVSVEEGTGVVHTSAAYGVDDLRLCQETGIPVRHTYPFCWRCKTPLIYYTLDSWYIRTTQFKAELLANNAATNWIPAYIKSGRMGDWLENNVDWAFSRTRYWGTPLPFWVCASCDAQRCVGSALDVGTATESDLHRPFIDSVKLPCDRCGGDMERVPEVLDAWFDSGSMPFAQRGYPRRGKAEFEATFPADFIAEAIDQTRSWFYTLLAISTILFGRNAYRNVICVNHGVDIEGRKASKSRGNVQDPEYLFETTG